MFKNQRSPQEAKDDPNIQIFRNIRKSKLHRVATHATIFPCTNAISWIVWHVDLDNRYILNTKERPITSFQESNIASFYHLEKGDLSLDEEVIKKFSLKENDLCKFWYKPEKLFKIRSSGEYTTNCWNTHKQWEGGGWVSVWNFLLLFTLS